MQIHLAIYHPQQAGILSAAISLGAEKVILLHREEDTIDGIQSVLRQRGIQCQTQNMDFDTQSVREAMAAILEQHQGDQIIFNASCGYQKWVLLGYEQFTSYGYPVFMVDKFTDELHWLNEKTTSKDQHLSHEVKIHEYLKAFNTHVLDEGQTQPEPQSSRDLTAWIIEHIGIHDKAIASLNYMAMSADQQHRYELSPSEARKPELAVLLDKFTDAGMLSIKGRKLKFEGDDARFYCNGGWLENHVYALTYGMRKNRPFITDLAKGLMLARHHGQVKNELDVVAMSHNRLHIIECKTRRFGQSKSEKAAASSAIYRLDTIKALTGGLSGRAMLISYQPVNKYTLSRAKDLGIHCCAHTQLKQLERHLYQFFDQ